ncbi:MAG: hypothetical protein CMH31_05330 [Micavibrio sp.]|nr:hypothetical protein [Micavibrio sp.]
MWFIIVFIAIPLAEIATFMQVGEIIGTPATLLLSLITAIIGGYLVKQQGMHTLIKAQKQLSTGQMPVQELFDGVCLIAAGAMMITPGFVTDTIGFLLLTPPVRVILKEFLIRTGKFSMQQSFSEPKQEHYQDSTVIEVEYERVDTPDKKD